MKKSLMHIAALAAMIIAAGLTSSEAQAIGPTCRVYPSAGGPVHDGASWSTAYIALQDALAQTACTEIWVAAGVYTPGMNLTDSFIIRDHTEVYGGFDGTEASRAERDPAAHVTILSGDSTMNDVNTDGNRIDETAADIVPANNYHVVWMEGNSDPGITANTVLDGLTITGGLAVGAYPDHAGAGLYCHADGAGHACSPTLRNLTFSGNAVASYGGAVALIGNLGAEGSPQLSNVLFAGNSAGYEAGAMYYENSQGVGAATFVNVTFEGNSAAYGGALGVIENNGDGVGPTLTNVTFHGNQATTRGGAFDNEAIGPNLTTLKNVILWGDTAPNGPELYAASSTHSISYSLIQGGCASIAGALCGDGNLDANPLLGRLHNNGGNTKTMALITGSPAIDAGTNTDCPSTDQRGGLRPVDGDGDGTLTCDIGAVEYQGHLFADVPVVGKEWMEPWIDAFYYAGVTTGCGVGPLIYCPENNVTRAEMAVFLLRAKHGIGYAPPSATHNFSDVPVAGKEWMEPWIDQFYAEGITTGCGVDPLRYCPEQNVTRAEMAVFIGRSIHTPGFTPPEPTGIFFDVPVAGKEWMEPWIEHFYSHGITTGCGLDPLRYCPENNTTRAEMAVFIDRAYTLYP